MENKSNIKTISDEAPISKEQLAKELDIQSQVVKEILERQEEERIKNITTNPSAIALSTTKHSSGDDVRDVRKSVKQLFNLYLTNQFVARAVNVRADTVISKGYSIVGEDKKGVESCENLIKNSGGPNLVWQLHVNTEIAGDGFLEKVYNVSHTAITRLKHVHPLTLSFKKDPQSNQIIINKETKEPKGYVQYYTEGGVEKEKDISKKVIEHLKFNTLGDEFTGISIIQPGYDTIVRLMNMEYSAAEAAIKTANPMWVGKCNTKSANQVAQWGMILGKITGKDQIFIPEGMELEMKSPGAQNFSDYADYFLDATVATFGVPKGILLGGSSGSGNRAQEVVLSRHYYSSVRGNQHYIEEFFNNIFKEYGKIAGFAPPKLVFEDIAEDADVNAESAINLFASNIIDRDEARAMIGLEPNSDKKVDSGGVTTDLKASDMETYFPETPGSPAGSQKNVKTDAKKTPVTTTKTEV